MKVEQPEDVGLVLEGVEMLINLSSILFGVIYALKLSYKLELKFTCK